MESFVGRAETIDLFKEPTGKFPMLLCHCGFRWSGYVCRSNPGTAPILCQRPKKNGMVDEKRTNHMPGGALYLLYTHLLSNADREQTR